MSLFRLVWRNLLSHPVRSMLTVGGIALAVYLFCFLRSIVTSLDAAVTASKSNRMVVTSAVSLFQALPTSYLPKIKGIDGVEEACNFTWFGGRYQKPENFFAQFATDPEELLVIYPEAELPEDQKQAWYADRQGAIIGAGLAEKYGWKPGDQVPIMGTIYVRQDGSEWTFNINGVYVSRSALVDEQTMFFHWDYLDLTLDSGDAVGMGPRGSNVYILRIKEGYDPADIAEAIDSHYEGGPQRTRTQPEAAFQASFVNMMGNLPVFLGTIAGAVLVAILFGVVNTMTMAARERTRSMGILKSLGFPSSVPARLYLTEAALLALIGGSLGIGLAKLTELPIRRALGTQIPMYHVAPRTILMAAGICVLVGVLAGVVPAWRASRLRPADALRRGA